MGIKKHVLFVISDEPLGLGKEILEKISNRATTQHLVYEELELEPRQEGGMRTEKELPLHTFGKDMSLAPSGIGSTTSIVITSFLKNLVCTFFGYKPHYRKTDEEKQKTIEEMVVTDRGK